MGRVLWGFRILLQVLAPVKSRGATPREAISTQAAQQEITRLSEELKRAARQLAQLWTIGQKGEGQTPLCYRPAQQQPRSGVTHTHPCQIAEFFAKKVRINTTITIRTSPRQRAVPQARTAIWQEL